jgi:hypothetical protein
MNCYFCDLTRKPFGPSDLYLAPQPQAVLPDLVCRCSDGLILRTRFHRAQNQSVDHELRIEPIRISASIANPGAR